MKFVPVKIGQRLTWVNFDLVMCFGAHSEKGSWVRFHSQFDDEEPLHIEETPQEILAKLK